MASWSSRGISMLLGFDLNLEMESVFIYALSLLPSSTSSPRFYRVGVHVTYNPHSYPQTLSLQPPLARLLLLFFSGLLTTFLRFQSFRYRLLLTPPHPSLPSTQVSLLSFCNLRPSRFRYFLASVAVFLFAWFFKPRIDRAQCPRTQFHWLKSSSGFPSPIRLTESVASVGINTNSCDSRQHG